MNLAKYIVVAVVGAGIALAVWRIAAPSSDGRIVNVSVPQLSGLALAGEVAFTETCAACHGKNGAGTDTGPPLVHDIYNPGHHPDISFLVAVRNGTRQHHWRFGNMPPQGHVSDADVTAIVAYVRALQEANGIVYRPHQL